jgi:tRNA(His) 5'-end guanylyltransferase
MKDALGDRMKSNYEDRTRISLPRRGYTIIRIDGKAFHTYTKGLRRPFDFDLIDDMDETAAYLCKNIMGAKFAYVQSDEISILITDFEDEGTQAWFDNNLQKMASVSASMATAIFNKLRMDRYLKNLHVIERKSVTDKRYETEPKLAMFDARVFQIPQRVEVENYFIWRQQDATRNSISSVAQSLYSPKQLHGVKTDGMQELIFQAGTNWNDFSAREKRGGIIRKIEKTFVKKDTTVKESVNTVVIPESSIYKRSVWELDVDTPIFTQDREYLNNLIPINR